MIDVLVMGGFLGLMASVGGGLAWVGGRDRLMKSRAKSVVIVTLKSGLAFKGVLFDVDGRSFVLRNAQAFDQEKGSHIPVDGEVFLSRSDVEFFQRP